MTTTFFYYGKTFTIGGKCTFHGSWPEGERIGTIMKVTDPVEYVLIREDSTGVSYQRHVNEINPK